jgi:hypothetical protein
MNDSSLEKYMIYSNGASMLLYKTLKAFYSIRWTDVIDVSELRHYIQ